jgi:hypothetical protein
MTIGRSPLRVFHPGASLGAFFMTGIWGSNGTAHRARMPALQFYEVSVNLQ